VPSLSTYPLVRKNFYGNSYLLSPLCSLLSTVIMSETISVLVVDDNPAMADTLADILEPKGFIVHAAASGAQALAILRERPVDTLVTDVKMPEMNGLELYRATRALYPKLITIFMTAYAADDLIQQGMAEGVKIVLDKPLDINFMLSLFSAEQRLINQAVHRYPLFFPSSILFYR